MNKANFNDVTETIRAANVAVTNEDLNEAVRLIDLADEFDATTWTDEEFDLVTEMIDETNEVISFAN